MKATNPTVFLLAEPNFLWGNAIQYLNSIEAHQYVKRMGNVPAPPSAEALVEFAGRLCYKSWEPRLNANVTKVREDSGEYLQNILKQKHGAVLEHAQFTFLFADVSRVFTHELVRHRAGVGISQESLRYVRLTDIGFRVPPILSTLEDEVISIVEQLEEFQRTAAEHFGLDDEGVPFAYKKEVTSALRRLAPLGLSTSILWSANIRTLRHVLELRTTKHAEEEMRLVFDDVGHILQSRCPHLFKDFTRTQEGEWTTPHSKV